MADAPIALDTDVNLDRYHAALRAIGKRYNDDGQVGSVNRYRLALTLVSMDLQGENFDTQDTAYRANKQAYDAEGEGMLQRGQEDGYFGGPIGDRGFIEVLPKISSVPAAGTQPPSGPRWEELRAAPAANPDADAILEAQQFQDEREGLIAEIEAAREGALPQDPERKQWQKIAAKIDEWKATGEDTNYSAANFNGWEGITSDVAERYLAYRARGGPLPLDDGEWEQWLKIAGKIEQWKADGEDTNFSAANFNGWQGITPPVAERCLAYLANEGHIVKTLGANVYTLPDELPAYVDASEKDSAEIEGKHDAALAPLLSGDHWEGLHRPEPPANSGADPNNQATPVKPEQKLADTPPTPPVLPTPAENEQDPSKKFSKTLGHDEDGKAETAEEAAAKAAKKNGGPNILSRTMGRVGRTYDRLKNVAFGDPMDTEGKLHGDADIFRFVLASHGIADMPHMRRKHVGTHTADKLVLYRPNSKCKHVYYAGGMKGKLVGRCDDNDYRAFISTLGLKKATITAKGNFDHQLFMKAHGIVGGVNVKTSINFDRGRNKRLLDLKLQQLAAMRHGPIQFPQHQETLPNTVKSSLLNPFGKLKAQRIADESIAAEKEAGPAQPQTKHRSTRREKYKELKDAKRNTRSRVVRRGRGGPHRKLEKT